MTTDALQLTEAESTLCALAARATELNDPKGARLVVRQLVETAQEFMPIIEEFEQTSDAYAIARSVLTFATEEAGRVCPYPAKIKYEDPEDRFRTRKENLPRVLKFLEKLEAKSS